MDWTDSIPKEDLAAWPALPPEYYARATPEVARSLVGKVLVLGGLAARIVETEAYLGPEDGASHAAPGLTPRNRLMFGPPAVAYVYFIYGMHHCVNAVAHEPGKAGAVLIRAAEPMVGLSVMRQRRPQARRRCDLTSGPGKLTQAFGIGNEHNGWLLASSALRIVEPPAADGLRVVVSPRIGIRKCATWPLRFFAAGHPCLSPSPFNRLGDAGADEQGPPLG